MMMMKLMENDDENVTILSLLTHLLLNQKFLQADDELRFSQFLYALYHRGVYTEAIPNAGGFYDVSFKIVLLCLILYTLMKKELYIIFLFSLKLFLLTCISSHHSI